MMEGFSRSLSYCINFSKFYQFRNICFFHMQKKGTQKSNQAKKKVTNKSENFLCWIRTQCFLKLSSLYKATHRRLHDKANGWRTFGCQKAEKSQYISCRKVHKLRNSISEISEPQTLSHKFTKKNRANIKFPPLEHCLIYGRLRIRVKNNKKKTLKYCFKKKINKWLTRLFCGIRTQALSTSLWFYSTTNRELLCGMIKSLNLFETRFTGFIWKETGVQCFKNLVKKNNFGSSQKRAGTRVCLV
jgi:hypothetical protein